MPTVFIVGAFLAAGIVSGLIWHLLWDAPTGVVVDEKWRVTTEDDYRAFFGATAWFVVLSAGFGAVVGLIVGLLTRKQELVALASLIVGSVLATLVMWQVGLALSSPDPTVLARGAADGTLFEAQISTGTWTPMLAFPAAAIFGFLVPIVLMSGEEKPRHLQASTHEAPRLHP